MTLEELAKTVTELKDRMDIRELMSRYARGVDRLDKDLLLSVYHSDGFDDHGVYVGSAEVFAECALSLEAEANSDTQHIITNHTCELDGDTAHTETYWIYAAMRREDGECRMGGGRYIDRLEKREGKWGIVVRKCLMDWSTGGGATPLTLEELAAMADMEKTTRDKNDPSYQRPLAVRPDRPAHGEGILAARRASRRAWPLAKEVLPFYD